MAIGYQTIAARFVGRRCAAVSVVQPRRPVVHAIAVPGPQGAVGGAGDVGPQGVPGDYGYVRFDEMAGLEPAALAPLSLTPFVITQPTLVDNNLRGPFALHQFLDEGNVLRARAINDIYRIRVRFQVRTSQAGGQIEIGAVVQGNISGLTGFVASRKAELSEAAGALETVDLDFPLFPKSGSLMNGTRLMVRCSVPATITGETLFIEPTSAGQ